MDIVALSLFPEQLLYNVGQSVTGRALEKGLFSFRALDIRSFADNAYGKVDDRLCGGGKGMLMQCEPVFRAWQEARRLQEGRRARTLYLSPKGRRLDQALVRELAGEEALILLCGHYEGVDERVLRAVDAEELSVGDYVLTGGELAASVLVDAVARLLPGVLPEASVYEDESHSRGLLESRHYTKPAEWRGRAVPEVLLGGHHERIARWRELDGLAQTLLKAPQLFDALQLDAATCADLIEHLKNEYEDYA